MTRWQELAIRFQKLADKTGMEKSSSYVLQVHFIPNGGIWIEMGCYDISDWPRHLDLGSFQDEEVALKAVEAKIIEAEEIVASESQEDEQDY